jgi:hypothetical protein
MKNKIMSCPLCGCENLHPQPPIFKGAYQEAGADYVIVIPFWCEEKCRGFIEYWHHEGTTEYQAYGESE